MMLNKIKVFVVLLGLIMGALIQTQAQDVYPGLVLYGSGNNAYLYNEEKELVHTWTSEYKSAGAPRLMRDSSIVFAGRNPNGWSGGALTGGQFQIITWDGEVIWDITYANSTICPHHNFEIMYYTDDQDEIPNVMAACYEKPSGSISCDRLVELKRTGPTSYEVAWEWAAWDHRTDDPDNHPELLEEPSDNRPGDWNHVNNVSYNRDLDQLVVDMKSFDEFVIIDHSTTIAEAAGHSGGDYGKGGDLLYRWGQASNYGISGNDYIVGFHGGIWILDVFPGTDLELPGAGNVLIYHNDRDEVVEIDLPGDGDGVYPRDQGAAWGPSSPTWTHDINASSHEGSVQRMPNGNTFICNSGGPMLEVTPSGQEIWTFDKGGIQSLKYAYSYLEQSTYAKKNISTVQHIAAPKIYSDPASGKIHISFNQLQKNAKVKIFSLDGRELYSSSVKRDIVTWNADTRSSGMYVVNVTIGNDVFNKYVNVIK